MNEVTKIRTELMNTLSNQRDEFMHSLSNQKNDLMHSLSNPKESLQFAIENAISGLSTYDDAIFETDTIEQVMQKKHWAKMFTKPSFWVKLCLASVAIVFVVVVNLFLPKGFWLGFFNLLNAMGPWARVVYFFLMIGLTLISVPPTITLIFGGFLLGFWWTLAIGHVAHLIGSSGSFVLGKYLIGNRIHNKFKDNKFFRALEIAVERSSLKISIMLRLCPILPIVAVTYMLAVTRVKYWHFVVATAIFLIPEVCMYVYLGSTASSVTQVLAAETSIDFKDTAKLAIMAIGLILSIVMAVGVSLITKYQVDKVLKEEKAKEAAEAVRAKQATELTRMFSPNEGDDALLLEPDTPAPPSPIPSPSGTPLLASFIGSPGLTPAEVNDALEGGDGPLV